MYITKKRLKYLFLRKRTAVIITFVICVPVIYNYFFDMNLETFNACHYLEEGDSLPIAKDNKFTPRPNSIFFHETSCQGGLTPRQACVIESAARTHPEKQIYVLFSAPVSEYSIRKSCLEYLFQVQNIRFIRVLITEYAKNTPLENLIARRPFSKSQWWVEHTSDLLRYLTLYKWGGLYLDTDMLVVKSLLPLGNNWLAMEDDVMVNGAAMAISRDNVGRNFINTLLYDVNDKYKTHNWGYNGPDAMTRTLYKICKTKNRTKWTSKTCGGLPVYSRRYFYPVHYAYCQEYFEKGTLVDDVSFAYTHHLWNKKTNTLTVECGSPLAKMVPKLCPTIYEMYSSEFGGNCNHT